MVELIIDQEFRDLIPPLNEDEFNGLERSIKSEGCRDPIIIWNNIIIDGHNRYNICKKNNISFNTINSKIELKTREDVIDWMYSNQLSRRNLTADQQSYFRGKQYTLRKSMIGANQYTKERSNHNDYPTPTPIFKPEKTIETMAKEYGVGQATIQRDEKYSIAVDNVAKIALENSDKTIGFSVLRDKITSNKINAPKKAIMELSKSSEDTVKKVFEVVTKNESVMKPNEKNDNEKNKISLQKVFQDVKREERKNEYKDTPILPTGKFNVIYADPPWKYSNSGFEMSAENKYPLMETPEIMKMEKPDTEENAVIFMWATNPLLTDALRVMESWGFNYKTNIVWTKERHTAGFYVFGQHELLLIGTKGSMLPIGEKSTSIVTGANNIHSKKPECVYDIIEKMYPNQKYVEMFARNTHKGWTSWGNQV